VKEPVFADRRDAGRVLAAGVPQYRGDANAVVLGLARGGVPVAYEVATAIGAPLDVFVVRKLGVPDHDELAMGAIASGGVIVLNHDLIRHVGVAPEEIERIAQLEGRELARREDAYRGGRPPMELTGRTVILVDDGLATGSSMSAAIQALRPRTPARVVVAVPTAPAATCREIRRVVDEVTCLSTPKNFYAVGEAYRNFVQTSDDEVRRLLARSTTLQGNRSPTRSDSRDT
jgi:predicted phosphoribosyltransferase